MTSICAVDFLCRLRSHRFRDGTSHGISALQRDAVWSFAFLRPTLPRSTFHGPAFRICKRVQACVDVETTVQ